MELFAVLVVTLVVMLKAAEAEPIQNSDFSAELAQHPGLKTYIDQAIAAVEARFEAKCETLQGTLAEHQADNLVLRKELSKHAIELSRLEAENTVLREELREHASELEKHQTSDSANKTPYVNTVKDALANRNKRNAKNMYFLNNFGSTTRMKALVLPARDGDLKRAESVEARVAFFASMNITNEHLGANQNIHFENVVMNLGNAYNGNLGTFIAPTAGVYLFATTLCYDKRGKTWGQLVVNGGVVAKIYVHEEQGSHTIVVHLNRGDDVSVQNELSGDRYIFGDICSSFSGVLLYEYPYNPSLVG